MFSYQVRPAIVESSNTQSSSTVLQLWARRLTASSCTVFVDKLNTGESTRLVECRVFICNGTCKIVQQSQSLLSALKSISLPCGSLPLMAESLQFIVKSLKYSPKSRWRQYPIPLPPPEVLVQLTLRAGSCRRRQPIWLVHLNVTVPASVMATCPKHGAS